jgi:hypothetical protein
MIITNWLHRTLSRLRIHFPPDPEKTHRTADLQAVFNLLTALMAFLFILTALWSVAAGVLQSGRLVRELETLYPPPGHGWFNANASWIAPLTGMVVYPLKAFAVVLLIGLASSTAGGLLGFLFGLPRQSGARASDGSARTDITSPTATSSPPSRRDYELSGHLTEVADWLTKIIVGIGLVEARAIYTAFSGLTGAISSELFGGRVGSSLVVPAVMVASAMLGFFFAYLLAQLFLSSMVAEAANALETAARTVTAVRGEFEQYARNLRPGGTSGSGIPTAEQRRLAERMRNVPLEQVTSTEDKLTWARARVASNDYVEAAKAYNQVWSALSSPYDLFEAALTLVKAGTPEDAVDPLQKAIANVPSNPPLQEHKRIVFSFVWHMLSEPGGYKALLPLFERNAKILTDDPDGRLHIVYAFAQVQDCNEKVKDQPDTEKKTMEEEKWKAISGNLNEGIKRGGNYDMVRGFAANIDGTLRVELILGRMRELASQRN